MKYLFLLLASCMITAQVNVNTLKCPKLDNKKSDQYTLVFISKVRDNSFEENITVENKTYMPDGMYGEKDLYYYFFINTNKEIDKSKYITVYFGDLMCNYKFY